MPMVYNDDVPIEFFDFIVVDESHRSIYNLWRQVLDYFDAFRAGLTATPNNRTYGYFKENVVSKYSYERAVADGVNIGYDIFTIENEITKNGKRMNYPIASGRGINFVLASLALVFSRQSLGELDPHFY